MKISKIIFLGVLALTSGQDPPDPDTTQPAEPTEERIKLTVLIVIQSPPEIIYGPSSQIGFILQVLISIVLRCWWQNVHDFFVMLVTSRTCHH